MKQLLLFPDRRPLVERLGADFFQRAPDCPGVYLMRSPADEVLYVGKAKNLRKRLGSYRVANPDRMSRRHLRLVNSVSRIELHPCDSEISALAKESSLLRNLRPRFNRVGTWPSSAQYLIWRVSDSGFDLGVARTLDQGWFFIGPIGSWAVPLRNALLRLLWCAFFPEHGLAGMPQGWFHGRCGAVVRIPFSPKLPDFKPLSELLVSLSEGSLGPFEAWLQNRAQQNSHPFEALVRSADLELLTEVSVRRNQTPLS